jgi:hypothetical protein
MRGDVTLAPFLVGHRLVGDGVNDIGLLRALVEHPQVLAQGNEGRQFPQGTLEADFGPLGSAPYNLLNSRAKARGATV